MKRILSIILITLLSFSVSAQIGEGDKRFSFVGGLNISYLNGDDGEDVVDDFEDMIDDYDDQAGVSAEGGIKPRIGMHLGFGYDYFIADNIAINSGLIYSMKGFRIKQDISGTTTSGSYPFYYTNSIDSESDIKINLNYIDIPIGVKYVTDEGFELSVGVVISMLASDKVDYDVDDSNSYYYNSQDEPEDYEDMFGEDPEGRVMGYHLGVGYHFNEKFSVSFKLQQGGEFGEIAGDDENKNMTLQFSTGIFL